MIIIYKSEYVFFKKNIKINKKIFFKNIKIIFEKILYKKTSKWVIICHALTGSHHFTGLYKKNLKNTGWWNQIINKNILNKKLNFICINNINSNFGTTNNLSINPINNKIYKNNFPKIKINKWIKIQYNLIKLLKINNIFIIIGGSIGGIQTIIWSLMYPNIINFCICIASTKKMSKNNLIKNKINKLVKNYNEYIINNTYFDYNIKSIKNLKLLRIIGHLSYLSNYDLNKKNLKKNFFKNYKFNKIKTKISKYFYFKSNFFYKNFNINSYLYIINLLNKFKINTLKKKYNLKLNYIIISFKNDKRFYYKYSKYLIKYFIKKNFNLNFKIIKNKSGHDSFLIKNLFYNNLIQLYIKYISER